MLTTPLRRLSATLALLAFPLVGQDDQVGFGPPPKGDVGDTPEHTFQQPLIAGQGITSLADLRGRPVLIDFWGTRCPPCRSFAVPKALELAQHYGDDLVVLFVEAQNSGTERAMQMAADLNWMGSPAIWANEWPFDPSLRALPHSVLIAPNGEIVLSGRTMGIHNLIEEQIEAFVETSLKAPEGTPKSLVGPWKEFGKGKFGDAHEKVTKVANDSAHEDREAAAATLAEFERRLDVRLRRLEWQVDTGRVHLALQPLEELADALEDHALGARVQTLVARTEEHKGEAKIAKKLAKLEETLRENGPNEKLARKLRKLVEDYPDTLSAQHAVRVAEWASVAPE